MAGPLKVLNVLQQLLLQDLVMVPQCSHFCDQISISVWPAHESWTILTKNCFPSLRYLSGTISHAIPKNICNKCGYRNKNTINLERHRHMKHKHVYCRNFFSPWNYDFLDKLVGCLPSTCIFMRGKSHMSWKELSCWCRSSRYKEGIALPCKSTTWFERKLEKHNTNKHTCRWHRPESYHQKSVLSTYCWSIWC